MADILPAGADSPESRPPVRGGECFDGIRCRTRRAPIVDAQGTRRVTSATPATTAEWRGRSGEAERRRSASWFGPRTFCEKRGRRRPRRQERPGGAPSDCGPVTACAKGMGMGFDVVAIAGHGALSAGSRPDGPSWFPYAFVGLAARPFNGVRADRDAGRAHDPHAESGTHRSPGTVAPGRPPVGLGTGLRREGFERGCLPAVADRGPATPPAPGGRGRQRLVRVGGLVSARAWPGDLCGGCAGPMRQGCGGYTCSAQMILPPAV